MRTSRSVSVLCIVLVALPAVGAASRVAGRRLPYRSYSAAIGPPGPTEPWYGPDTGCPSLRVFSNREEVDAAIVRALSCREEVAATARSRGDVRREIVALTELAGSHRGTADDERRQWMNRALDLVESLGEVCWHASLLRKSAYSQASLIEKREIIPRAVDAARDGACGMELTISLYTWGIYLPRQDPDAVVHLQESLDLARSLDNPALLVLVAHTLAKRYASHGDLRALALRRELISLHQARGDHPHEMDETWNLAVTFDHLDDPLAAVPLLERYVTFLETEGRAAEREFAYLQSVKERARSSPASMSATH